MKDFKIIWTDIGNVKPYGNNPRKNDGGVEAVAASLKEFCFQQPIVVDKNYVVITGHTTLKAAQKLGLKQVPVKVAAELTEEEITAYRIADNKTAELSNWDDDKLADELGAIEGIDLMQFGFGESDFNDGENAPASWAGDMDGENGETSGNEMGGGIPELTLDGERRRVIITYKTEEEKAFLTTLLKIQGEIKPLYKYGDLKAEWAAEAEKKENEGAEE